jgi:4-aminobutyrate aminotransferase-like enzyme
VLKIRSPLTLEPQHADLLIDALDRTLQSQD